MGIRRLQVRDLRRSLFFLEYPAVGTRHVAVNSAIMPLSLSLQSSNLLHVAWIYILYGTRVCNGMQTAKEEAGAINNEVEARRSVRTT